MIIPKLRSIKGNLTTVLSVFDTQFKSIKAFMKAHPDLNTKKEAETFLLDNYNEIIDNINKNEKNRL